jgi:hypothetical protein
MFRGSAKLRDYDYRALIPLVKLLRRPQAQVHRGISLQSAIENIGAIMDLLREVDACIEFRLPTVSRTNTLKTKILLGTIACIPAYDRFVNDAIASLGWPQGLSGYAGLLARAKKHSPFQRFSDRIAEDGFSIPPIRALDAFLNNMGRQLGRS